MWPRIVAGIFIPVGNHYFQALASTLQFVAQVCDRLWLVPATDRAFAYITYMSPPHVALVCSGPPQCAATCGWTKWPVCSGPYSAFSFFVPLHSFLSVPQLIILTCSLKHQVLQPFASILLLSAVAHISLPQTLQLSDVSFQIGLHSFPPCCLSVSCNAAPFPLQHLHC